MSNNVEKAITWWQVYENNVQQYRILCVTVQSFFLAVGSLIATSSRDEFAAVAVMTIVAIIGVVHLYFIWHLTLRARHKIVDYYKYQIDSELNEQNIIELKEICSQNEYVKNDEMRKRINFDYFNQTDLRVFRETRKKFDIFVPVLYAVIWFVLWIWTIHSHLQPPCVQRLNFIDPTMETRQLEEGLANTLYSYIRC